MHPVDFNSNAPARDAFARRVSALVVGAIVIQMKPKRARKVFAGLDGVATIIERTVKVRRLRPTGNVAPIQRNENGAIMDAADLAAVALIRDIVAEHHRRFPEVV